MKGLPRSNAQAPLATTTRRGAVLKAATVAAPASITAYTAHASGSTPVTSNAATDLDTTAAAVATLRSEVNALKTTVASLLANLKTAGVVSTS